MGSLNDSGINIKECVGHSGLESQSANISWRMRFEECRTKLWRRLDQSDFRPMAEVSFPVLVSRANAKGGFRKRVSGELEQARF